LGKRVTYFDRQFLRAEDFQVEQGYHLGRRRGISAGMFRPGVAVGLEVVRVDAGSVRVTAGLAIDRLGREIVLDGDSGAIPADPGAAVEVWIAYAEAPSDPVSYLGADEQRFTRIAEAPAIVPVPPGNVPADGIRLAVVPPGGEPDMSARPVAGPRDGSVAGLSLADDAVTSRALAEADGASDQDTDSGSGVKTGHIQNGAVTSDKLAEDVVDGLAERTIDKLLQRGVPIGDRSVTPDMLADDAVSSRALAEAAPGSTDQDTGSGTGVKTGHLADQSVTEAKLAAGAVSFDKIATRAVFNVEVTVPGGTQGGDPGSQIVMFETVPAGETALYLVSVSMFPIPSPIPVQSMRWTHFALVDQIGTQGNGIRLENFHPLNVDVRCVAFRLV
jgi:hypothetical protein